MGTIRDSHGKLRQSAGTTDGGKWAVDRSAESTAVLERAATAGADAADERIAAQLDAVDQVETGELRWGNAEIGSYRSLRELHTAASAKLVELDAEHGEFDPDEFSTYPDRELHRELHVRRARIESGGPVWSWNGGPNNDVLTTVAAIERNRTAARLSEMAEVQDTFAGKMDAAESLDEKLAALAEARNIRFAGDAAISVPLAALKSYKDAADDRDDANISAQRADDAPPEHYSSRRLDHLREEAVRSDEALETAEAAFLPAFEEAKARVRASTDNLRAHAVALTDDVKAEEELAAKLWRNGWPGTDNTLPPVPADFRDSEVATRAWGIAQTYR